jgi:hypothetical protein
MVVGNPKKNEDLALLSKWRQIKFGSLAMAFPPRRSRSENSAVRENVGLVPNENSRSFSASADRPDLI